MAHSVYGTRAWKALSRQCIERDGHQCQIRLPGCTGFATTADHVIELDEGGAPFDLGNLQAACRQCNSAKSNKRRALRRRGVRAW